MNDRISELLNVDLNEIPEIKDLLIPFCNNDRFHREVLANIKLAWYRGKQTSPTEHGDGDG